MTDQAAITKRTIEIIELRNRRMDEARAKWDAKIAKEHDEYLRVMAR